MDPWDCQVQAGWPPGVQEKRQLPLPPEAGLGRILQPVAFMESGTTTKSAKHKDPKVTKNISEREMRGLFIYLFCNLILLFPSVNFEMPKGWASRVD